MFADRGDYAAFERVMEAALPAVPVRLLGYGLRWQGDGTSAVISDAFTF
ncbi:MAG TPA: hypothetical protein VHY37_07105 [Tepidisphaeraceae bacterium]|jgi:hypothetical protein|nr:hypothetical protein [Tepidisphaeraceae bacterium]